MHVDLEREELHHILDVIEDRKKKLRKEILKSELKGAENRLARDLRDLKEFILNRLALIYNKLIHKSEYENK